MPAKAWRMERGEQLFEGRAVLPVPSLRPALPVLLFIVCLLPRMWAVRSFDVLCPDAVFYLQSAEAMARGDLAAAFAWLGLNVYPLILLALRGTGFDWIWSARLFSVVMASLAVLPLYGWMRRQFNANLAWVGCLAYALHPALVHDSPLVVRDPSFWLVFALALYLSWRAVEDLSWPYLTIFASVFAVAVHLRSEAWFLALPITMWTARRCAKGHRRRALLLAGVVLALLAGPLAGAAVERAFLAERGVTGSPRARHWRAIERWLTGAVEGTGPSFGVANAGGGSSSPAPYRPVAEYARRQTVRYVKGFGYLHGLLALAGLLAWRSRVVGPSKLPLLLLCLVSVLAIWVLLRGGGLDRRHVFPAVLVSLPVIAAGALQVAHEVGRRSGAVGCSPRSAERAFLVFVTSLLVADIVANPRPQQVDQAAVGRWVRRSRGPGQLIAGSCGDVRVAGYYAEGSARAFGKPGQCAEETLLDALRGDRPPDVVLLWTDWRNPEGRVRYSSILVASEGLGYVEVEREQLPPECTGMVVMVRALTASAPAG